MLAKEIGIDDENIKDTFVNTLQINNTKNPESEDLKKYATSQLLDKLQERLKLNKKFKKPTNISIYLLLAYS